MGWSGRCRGHASEGSKALEAWGAQTPTGPRNARGLGGLDPKGVGERKLVAGRGPRGGTRTLLACEFRSPRGSEIAASLRSSSLEGVQDRCVLAFVDPREGSRALRPCDLRASEGSASAASLRSSSPKGVQDRCVLAISDPPRVQRPLGGSRSELLAGAARRRGHPRCAGWARGAAPGVRSPRAPRGSWRPVRGRGAPRRTTHHHAGGDPQRGRYPRAPRVALGSG